MLITARPRSRFLRRAVGGFASLLAAAALVVVPSTPAFAIQTIAWTTAPPATATVGQQVSFAWSGTANTFLGARITGCYANFPEGNNFTRAFGGNFTTGNCNIVNRVIPLGGTYQIVVGFTLSTGGLMSMTWNVNMAAPTPTVYTSGPINTTATSVNGAPATYSAYGSDAVYGTYGATCSPQSGTTFPPGATTVTCSATNAGGKTGTASFPVTVYKANPTIAWNPPSEIVAGRRLGTVLGATVAPADAAGTISYSDGAGNALLSASELAAGVNQVLRATYTPTGQAANAYNSVTVERTVDVVRIPQSVSFGSTPTDVLVDADPFEVTAAGTADGGDVSIGATADSTCTVVDHGNGPAGAATVTVTQAGTCVLEAGQAQTATYLAAPVAQRSVTVDRRTPVVSWNPGEEMTYGATLAALLDASTTVPGTWAYRLNGDPVDGSTKPGAGLGQVLDVVFTPADASRYTTATASQKLDVLRAPQHLDVPTIADRTYGDAPFVVDPTSDGPGDITVTTSGPCTVAGRTVTPTSAGACEITVDQAAAANHQAAQVVRTVSVAKGTPVLTWTHPGDLTYGEVVGPDQLDAVVDADIDPSAAAPVGQLTFTAGNDAPAAGALLDAGDHLLTARWEPTGPSADRWKPIALSTMVHVDRALPVVRWPTPAAIVHGTPLGDEQLAASVETVRDVDGDLTYTLADGSRARGVVLGAGEHTLRATFDATGPTAGNYLGASEEVTLVVTKAAQVIDFTAPNDHAYGDAPFDVVATGGDSGQPVTFAADGACSVSGATVTITRAGACVVTASQDGTDDFEAATPVVRNVTITGRGTAEIAWATPDPIVFGTPLGADQLDAIISTPGATGTISYVLADGATNADGALLHAGAGQTITALFEPDRASEARFLPSSRTVSIDVAQAKQVIDLGALRDRTYGDPSVPLSATGGASGRPVGATATGACDLVGTTVRLLGAGTCTVSATQEGTADYAPAPSVTRSFAIAKAPLVVTAPSIKRRIGVTTALVPTYSGFVNGDGTSDLLEPATCVTEALATSPAGTYRVSCSGATIPDYEVSTVPGIVKIGYGIRGFEWSLAAARQRPGGARGAATIPVLIALTDVNDRMITRARAVAIGSECRATLRVEGVRGTTTCFRLGGADKDRPFLARLRSAALSRGRTHTVVLAITGADGTTVRRATIELPVR
ncbi:MAG: hypothetical protein JWN68_29 [Nocardioides sp.]|uniref:MBG domain-containing protein n=1 Tax=Nocardioides sp. TaxID=35761 RepID=UPI00260B29A2|nr:MBG domain-containing protein [Nocardioides sp.]MCW2832076.1 hypothetical protein [Nocardioides sp.]